MVMKQLKKNIYNKDSYKMEIALGLLKGTFN